MIVQKNKEVLETLDRLAKNPEFDADDAIVTPAVIYDQYEAWFRSIFVLESV